MSYTPNAVLSTGTSINPITNEGESAEDSGLVLHVMRTSAGKLVVWSGWTNDLKPYFEVGSRQEAHADQSGRYLGSFTCVGYVARANGQYKLEGEVPSRKIRHYVFK